PAVGKAASGTGLLAGATADSADVGSAGANQYPGIADGNPKHGPGGAGEFSDPGSQVRPGPPGPTEVRPLCRGLQISCYSSLTLSRPWRVGRRTWVRRWKGPARPEADHQGNESGAAGGESDRLARLARRLLCCFVLNTGGHLLLG